MYCVRPESPCLCYVQPAIRAVAYTSPQLVLLAITRILHKCYVSIISSLGASATARPRLLNLVGNSFPAPRPAHWRCLPSPSHAFRKLNSWLIAPVRSQQRPRPVCRHPLPRRCPKPPSLAHVISYRPCPESPPRAGGGGRTRELTEGPSRNCSRTRRATVRGSVPAALHAIGICAAARGRSDYPEDTGCAP